MKVVLSLLLTLLALTAPGRAERKDVFHVSTVLETPGFGQHEEAAMQTVGKEENGIKLPHSFLAEVGKEEADVGEQTLVEDEDEEMRRLVSFEVNRGGDLKVNCPKNKSCCTRKTKEWKKITNLGKEVTDANKGTTCYNDAYFDACQDRRCAIDCDGGCAVSLKLKDQEVSKSECYDTIRKRCKCVMNKKPKDKREKRCSRRVARRQCNLSTKDRDRVKRRFDKKCG